MLFVCHTPAGYKTLVAVQGLCVAGARVRHSPAVAQGAPPFRAGVWRHLPGSSACSHRPAATPCADQ